jgi:hydrogenase/urease accessory protein HupE
MGRTTFLRIFAFLLVALGFLPAARAHQVPSVELEFQNLEPDQPVWRLVGEMDIAYMLPETRTIPNGPPLSRAAVMTYPPEELARIRRETDNTLHKLIRITFAGKDVPWTTEFPDFEKQPLQLPPEAGDIALLSVRLTMPAQEGSGKLEAHWSGEQETELIILIGDDEDYGNVLSCLPGESLTLLQQTEAGHKEPPKQKVGGGFLDLGFHHVMGPDHILFILGLFLLLPKWKPLMKQSLLFTLAHSITLALAIFGLVHVSGVWVEHLIAISIAWVGIENLCVKKLGPWRMSLVFGFGLLHGLGFASVLAEKLKGVPRDRLLMPLLSFNAGVELAQIAILAVSFVLLWPIRRHTGQVRTIGSAVIALAGIAWAVQRLFFR